MAPKGLLLASGRKDDDSDEGSHVDGESDSDERIDADADGHVCCVVAVEPLRAGKLLRLGNARPTYARTCYHTRFKTS